MSDLLQQIQQLQFNKRSEAEALLLSFIVETFPNLKVENVELRPQVISLNSFNGFLTLQDGGRLFFKTHTEEDNRIDEYYNATMLAEAGYPIIQPLYSSTKAGQHLLIYEVIEAPSVFDVAWEIEQGDSKLSSALTQAQNNADKDLLNYLTATIAPQDADSAHNAPIHQLFYHRLSGGRMTRFYGDFLAGGGETIELPEIEISMGELAGKKWRINGQIYDETLASITSRAISILRPNASEATIIGHGDAHNGNVFFESDPTSENDFHLTYFDPAFAGRHHPLLDLTKPLFHNVFAMWMYFPEIKDAKTDLQVYVNDVEIVIDHNYELPEIRHMFLDSKIENTVIPIMRELKTSRKLREDWRTYLKSALFCCPFLTLNLADRQRFSPKIGALGLAMAVEMGADSAGNRSLMDTTLDYVEDSIR
ncbi:MAG: hypothetical protein RLP44_03300 [Aggregatilineales bacterium]